MQATEQPEIAQLPEEYILTPYSVSNSISAYILSHKLCYLKYGYYGYYVVKSNDYLYPITRNDPLYRSDDPPQGSDFGQWSDEMILFGTGLGRPVPKGINFRDGVPFSDPLLTEGDQ